MSSDENPRSPGLSDRARAFSVTSLISSSRLRTDAEDSVDVSSLQCANQLNYNQEQSLQNSNYMPNTSSVSAELLCRELWMEFHTLGTEMIINKAGR